MAGVSVSRRCILYCKAGLGNYGESDDECSGPSGSPENP